MSKNRSIVILLSIILVVAILCIVKLYSIEYSLENIVDVRYEEDVNSDKVQDNISDEFLEDRNKHDREIDNKLNQILDLVQEDNDLEVVPERSEEPNASLLNSNFIYMLLLGNTEDIYRLNELSDTNYLQSDIELMSEALRIMFPPNNNIKVEGDTYGLRVGIYDNDSHIGFIQEFFEGGLRMNGGLEYIDFVYYGIDKLCLSINSKNPELLMNTFGDDGIDDIATAEETLNKLCMNFTGDVSYKFNKIEQFDNIYHFTIFDSEKQYEIKVIVSENVGQFDFGVLSDG